MKAGMRRATVLAILGTACGLLGGCASAPPTPFSARGIDSPAAATTALPLVLSLPDYPLRQARRPTTAAAVYVGNLQARLAALDARPDRDSGALLAMRATATFELYQIEGRLAQLDAAEQLARRSVEAGPDNADAWLIHAQVQSHLHGFANARAALDHAAAVRAPEAEVAQLRAVVDAAVGKPAAASTSPRPFTAAADAVAAAQRCVELGDLRCASENFHAAQFLDNDSAPLPLAWLHTQQGIALLRFGHPQAAIRFFEAALERLPGYYVATEHLAECLGLIGHDAEAGVLYQQVIAQTGNPEYMAGYAALLQRSGDTAGAARWHERARVGYAALLRAHPAAFAGHAVDFYLETGAVEAARRLAQRNIVIRQDAAAWLLLARTAGAAGDCGEAQSALAAVDASGWHPPERAEAAAALQRCTSRR